MVQCKQKCLELYTGETKQQLNWRMAQHRRGNSSGPQSAVFLSLKDKGHSFDYQDVLICDRKDRWFEKGVREAINVLIENPLLNRSGGLRYIFLLFIMLPFHPSPEHTPERLLLTTRDDGWRRTVEVGFSPISSLLSF